MAVVIVVSSPEKIFAGMPYYLMPLYNPIYQNKCVRNNIVVVVLVAVCCMQRWLIGSSFPFQLEFWWQHVNGKFMSSHCFCFFFKKKSLIMSTNKVLRAYHRHNHHHRRQKKSSSPPISLNGSPPEKNAWRRILIMRFNCFTGHVIIAKTLSLIKG